MTSLSAKVGSRGRIVVPKEIRSKLRIGQGDTVLFLLEDGSVRLIPNPDNYGKYARGLGKQMGAELGGGERIVREERRL